jgi:deazaflavin-dependent oxidoreductase (nitroreductase family)
VTDQGKPAIDLSLFGDEHVRRYEETDGEVGYLWNGATCCVLTTTGRRSGQERKSALICGLDGDDVVLVASKGGAPDHPLWYRNLEADPQVIVQVKADRYRARARTADGEERDRLWRLMNGIWPSYDDYAARTDRRIPVVVLERIGS